MAVRQACWRAARHGQSSPEAFQISGGRGREGVCMGLRLMCTACRRQPTQARGGQPHMPTCMSGCPALGTCTPPCLQHTSMTAVCMRACCVCRRKHVTATMWHSDKAKTHTRGPAQQAGGASLMAAAHTWGVCVCVCVWCVGCIALLLFCSVCFCYVHFVA